MYVYNMIWSPRTFQIMSNRTVERCRYKLFDVFDFTTKTTHYIRILQQ